MRSTLKAPGTRRLKLKYDKLLFQFCFNFAFNFNLRRFTWAMLSSSVSFAVKSTALRVVGGRGTLVYTCGGRLAVHATAKTVSVGPLSLTDAAITVAFSHATMKTFSGEILADVNIGAMPGAEGESLKALMPPPPSGTSDGRAWQILLATSFTGARAKAWFLLIHAKASLSLSLAMLATSFNTFVPSFPESDDIL